MLETILKLYVTAMATGVTSPVPHLFGPPGSNKSTVVRELAKLVGVNVHVINVSRLNPLDLEGVQMPNGSGEDMILKMLHATTWTQLKPKDIILFDEFLRGFPEVYNGLLDIITGRSVAGLDLPPVFMLAASNSTVAYDKALEDRLHHIPVPDPRKSKRAKKQLAQVVVDELGLLPKMRDSMEMDQLLTSEVLPMYDVLDSLANKSSAPALVKGRSIRNLIGQAKLRDVHSAALKELLAMNNARAMQDGKPQYVFLLDGKAATLPGSYLDRAKSLPVEKLTPVQRLNRDLNLQLVEMEEIRNEKGTTTDDDNLDAILNEDVFS
jgi:MoxR-like ATPase